MEFNINKKSLRNKYNTTIKGEATVRCTGTSKKMDAAITRTNTEKMRSNNDSHLYSKQQEQGSYAHGDYVRNIKLTKNKMDNVDYYRAPHISRGTSIGSASSQESLDMNLDRHNRRSDGFMSNRCVDTDDPKNNEELGLPAKCGPSYLLHIGEVQGPRPSDVRPGAIKLGNHSIHLEGVANLSSSDLQDHDDPVSATNIVQSLDALWANSSDAVQFSARRRRFEITSRLAPWFVPDQQIQPFHVRTHASASHAAGTHINEVDILLNENVPLEMIGYERIAMLGMEGNPNSKNYIERMGQAMGLSSEGYPSLRSLADSWDQYRIVNDMSAMYAKMILLTLVRQRYTEEGIEPAFQELNDVGYVHIQIGSPGFVDQIRRHILLISSPIVFTDGEGYNYNDILFYYLLAMPGPHLRSPARANIIPSSMYRLPAMNIVILSAHARPPMPANRAWTADDCLLFVKFIASQRGDYDALIRGMIMAFELAGCDAVIINSAAGDRLARYTIMNAYLEVGHIAWPRPCDYNFCYKLMNIRPRTCGIYTNEANLFNRLDARTLLRYAIIYTALLRAMVTTALYNWNISGEAVQQIMLDQVTHPLLLQFVKESGMFTYDPHGDDARNANCGLIFNVAINLLRETTGIKTNICFSHHRDWNTRKSVGQLALGGLEDLFAYRVAPSQAHRLPYRIGSPLGIDVFLIRRPLEWGISAPGPVVNYADESIIIGRADQQGIYALRGDNTFSQQCISLNAMKLIPYAPAFYHCAMQGRGRRWIANIPWSCSYCNWNLGGLPYWNDQALGAWIPSDNLENGPHRDVCTIMTFDLSNWRTIAPSICLANFAPNQVDAYLDILDVMRTWRGERIWSIGYCRERAGFEDVPQLITVLGNLGRRPRNRGPTLPAGSDLYTAPLYPQAGQIPPLNRDMDNNINRIQMMNLNAGGANMAPAANLVVVPAAPVVGAVQAPVVPVNNAGLNINNNNNCGLAVGAVPGRAADLEAPPQDFR